jgi:hypothetical protein
VNLKHRIAALLAACCSWLAARAVLARLILSELVVRPVGAGGCGLGSRLSNFRAGLGGAFAAGRGAFRPNRRCAGSPFPRAGRRALGPSQHIIKLAGREERLKLLEELRMILDHLLRELLHLRVLRFLCGELAQLDLAMIPQRQHRSHRLIDSLRHLRLTPFALRADLLRTGGSAFTLVRTGAIGLSSGLTFLRAQNAG